MQTVNAEVDALDPRLISGFEKLSGLPVVLNTSFNIKGQPIVETPLDAVPTFAGTGIDALIMGEYLKQKPKTRQIN